MSDLGGIWGAMILSDQIGTNRMLDSFRRAREASNITLNDAAWRNQYNTLVNQYNHFLNDANRLADGQDTERALKERQIAHLTAANEASTAKVEQLRQELEIVRGLIAVERAMYREKHPEDFE